MPEIAKVALVAALSGGWVLVLFGILGCLVGDGSGRAANVQDWLHGVAALGMAVVVVSGLVFFGGLIVALARMWWG